MKNLLSLVLALCLLLSCASAAFAEEAAKPVILVVSFGTSYNDNRELTIGAVEADIQAAFPDYEVRRAFTAQTIIDKLAERDGIETDNVTQAMERLIADGVKDVILQPTHVMNGFEYDDVIAEITPYVPQFDSFRVGEPLLTGIEDYEAVTEALLADNEFVGEADTAVVYMGHGTEHFANATYSQLEAVMHSAGYENAFVGTVEGYPGVDEVIAKLSAAGVKKVALYPLMLVAGDHANNDMAGDEEDSWKTLLTNAGFEVTPFVQGMGQSEAIRALYVAHVQAAIDGEIFVPTARASIEKGETDPAKKAIVVVSFGTSYNDSRDATIGAIEADIAAAYPDWTVSRAFTAQTIIDKLAVRDGLVIENVTQAMERLATEGYGTVLVQPTHVMNGFEYDDLVAEAGAYAHCFDKFAVGAPLLTEEDDYEKVIDALLANNENSGSAEVALVYMGHGTEHCANATYSEMQAMMHDMGYENAFVGTVEGFPGIEETIAQVTAYGAKKVVLAPFMVVAGDHANNDMAGDEEDSWKSIFANAGFEVECVLEGMGQNPAIRALYVSHVQDAIEESGL